MTKYYRYQESLSSSGKVWLHLIEYSIIKITKFGVWLEDYPGNKRFVLISARKRFACPSKEEALESYYARKKRQIKILTHQLAKAKAALEATPEQSNLIIHEDYGFLND